MGDSSTLVFALLGVTFGTLWLTIYAIGLFRFGLWLSKYARFRRSVGWMFFNIGFWSGVPASLCLLTQADIVGKGLLGVGLWMLHSHPIAAGYWSGCEAAKREDHRCFRIRAEQWLEPWESPPTWLNDDPDR